MPTKVLNRSRSLEVSLIRIPENFGHELSLLNSSEKVNGMFRGADLRLKTSGNSLHSMSAQKDNEYEEKRTKKGDAVSFLLPQEMLPQFRDMCLSSNLADFAVVRRSSNIVLEAFEFEVIIGYIFLSPGFEQSCTRRTFLITIRKIFREAKS